MRRCYILNPDHTYRRARVYEWALWNEKNFDLCVVGKTLVGAYTVSTVFLGLDHNWSGKGPPRVFETCTFDSAKITQSVLGPIEESEIQGRCSTWEEAEAMHAATVKRLAEETGCEPLDMPRTISETCEEP